MPVIEIFEPDGSLNVFAGVSLVATAIYPRSEDQRRAWKAAAIARGVADEMVAGGVFQTLPETVKPRFISDTLETISSLYQTKTSPQRTFDLGVKRQATLGHLCGGIFEMLRILKHHHPEHAMVERAMWLIASKYQDLKSDDGKAYPTSGSSLAHAWADLQGVAHLHFYFALMPDEEANNKDLLLEPRDLSNEADVEWFLGHCTVLEDIREDAEEQGILDPGKSWRLPEGTRLFERWHVPAPEPLSDEDRRALDRTYLDT